MSEERGSKFGVGDVVGLRSGGPLMTVELAEAGCDAHCVYWGEETRHGPDGEPIRTPGFFRVQLPALALVRQREG